MKYLEQARRLIKECKETKNPYLDLEVLNITNLEDVPELQECTHLEILNLGGNHISNISLLKELKSLQNLHLRHNEISDISVLKGLKQLQYLDLSHNKISDISVLKELKSLQTVDFGYNKISDISFLEEINQLKILYLNDNNLKEIPKSVFQLGMKINMKDCENDGLFIYGNPIESPPVEIIKQERQLVLNWFDERNAPKFDKIMLSELSRVRRQIDEIQVKLGEVNLSDVEKEKLKKEEQRYLIRVDEIDSYFFKRNRKLNKKIEETFTAFEGLESGIKIEIKRLTWLFYIFSFLTVLAIVCLSIIWINVINKIYGESEMTLFKFWTHISPSFILAGFIWASIVQINRAQRQLVALRRHNRYETIQIALKGYYGVENDVDKRPDKLQDVLNDIIKQALEQNNYDKEELNLDKEIAKDKASLNKSIDSIIEYSQKVKDLIK